MACITAVAITTVEHTTKLWKRLWFYHYSIVLYIFISNYFSSTLFFKRLMSFFVERKKRLGSSLTCLFG
jgi:hypothetical protein